MSLKNIKLVTFDVTNTLLKFKLPPGQQYGAIGRKFGYKGSNEELARRFVTNYRQMWQQHPNFGRDTELPWREWWRFVVCRTFKGQLPSEVDLNDVATCLIEEYKSASLWQRAKGADHLIEVLRSQSIALGVISNFDPRLTEILHNVSLHKYFNFVIASYESGCSKPDVRIFEAALAKCPGLQSFQALHIGDDMEKDYDGARSAGWNAILIDGHSKIDHAYQSLDDLALAIQENRLIL